ncbi:MAG: alpha/beta fold hydrolase [Hyphomicrobiaceae bacterium]|nr:alpha/beta fold hydrolase [Hyphomicrobiaceae bacterium]
MTLPRIMSAGVPLARADKAVIMLHGRGATAPDILTLTDHFEMGDLAYIAPQAPANSWYPYSFLAPLEQNEPALSQALAMVGELIDGVAKEGINPERVVLLGFSQGGCLALEYAARHARRYAAVIGLSAGLIGPQNTPREYAGSLAGTPVFLGCGDMDDHIPLERVKDSTKVLRGLGGDLKERIYRGMGHGINEDELLQVRSLLQA